MVNKYRTHSRGGPTNPTDGAPRQITLEEFGKRLYNAMIAKNWRQADLARATELPRDSISTYIRGLVKPTPLSLSKLATALGKTEEELFPNHAIAAVIEDHPTFEMKVSPNDPRRAYIRLNRMVSFEVAVKIAELVNADPADRE